jgi:hypothetical protein
VERLRPPLASLSISSFGGGLEACIHRVGYERDGATIKQKKEERHKMRSADETKPNLRVGNVMDKRN